MEVMTKPEPTDEIPAEEVSAEEVSAEEVSAGEVSAEEVSAGEAPDDETPIDRIKIGAHTIDSDIANFIVDRLRHYDTPFPKQSEREQQDEIRSIKETSRKVTEDVVEEVIARGFESIPVSISKAENNGKTIKVTLEASHSNAQAAELLMSAGYKGRLVIANVEEFFGGEMPKAEPDQREIPLSNDNDDDQEHDTADDGDEADNEDDEQSNQFDENGIIEDA